MTTYFIGDIQGCYISLMQLLEQITYNAQNDTLVLCGDMVNRGPKSLEVMQFILEQQNIRFVLGNHDIYALYYLLGGPCIGKDHSLDALIASKQRVKFLDVLLNGELMLYEPGKYAAVHAGLAPQWDYKQAFAFAKFWPEMLKAHEPLAVVQKIWGNDPCDSEYADDKWHKLRYIVNVFTRIRFCDARGALDFKSKMKDCPLAGYKPWFAWREGNPNEPLFFGHWAALRGIKRPGIIGLDTGCAWGGELTAYALESGKSFTVGMAD